MFSTVNFSNEKEIVWKPLENLGKGREILKECGVDGWVGKYEKEMASLP